MSGTSLLTWWLEQLALAPLAVAILFKVTLILLGSWLVHLALARTNPCWRRLLWRATAVALVSVPILHFRGPALNLPIPSASSIVPFAPGGEPTLVDAGLDHAKDTAENANVVAEPSSELGAALPSTKPVARAQVPPQRTVSSSATGVLQVLLFVWGVGASLLLLRLAVGISRVVRLVRNAIPAPGLVMREFRRVCDQLGYDKTLRVRRSGEVKTPLLCGLLRPVLILPDPICDGRRGSDHLSAILAHELSHARSRDTFWNTVVHMSGIVLWFHPFAWRMRRAHAAACEAVSDCVAADYVGDVESYARVLARVTLDSTRQMPITALAMGHRCDVSKRVCALRRRVFAGGLGWRRTSTFLVMGTLLIAAVAGLHVVLLEVPVIAGEEPAPEEKNRKGDSPADLTIAIGGLKDTQTALAKGLRYLASQQNDDGSFGKKKRTGGNVGVVSLAGLAFIEVSNKPGKREFADEIEGVADYVLANARQDGLIRSPDAASHGVMYEHAYATRFLAEGYGQKRNERLLKPLANAVMLIVASQNHEGGWRYLPTSMDADISVTSCQIIALVAAKRVGIAVPQKTLDRAVEYVRRCQNADGGFAYMSSQRGESGLPRSAAAMTALFTSGVKDETLLKKGVDYVMSQLPSAQNEERRESYFFYSRYYAIETASRAGPSKWGQWYKEARDELLSRQKPDGSWHHALGSVYATALACLTLQNHPLLPKMGHRGAPTVKTIHLDANERAKSKLDRMSRARWLEIEMGMKADSLERANPIRPSQLPLPNQPERKRIAPSRIEPRDR